MAAGTTSTIEIDLEIHRELERRRTSFEQTQADILRQALGLSGTGEAAVTAAPSVREPPSRGARLSRVTGRFEVKVLDKSAAARSLKEAYLTCLRMLAAYRPGLLDALSKQRTRSRRIVARDPAKLYLNRPALAEDYAEKLDDDWWVDINLSRPQIELRLNLACDLAGLDFGKDVVIAGLGATT